MKTTSSPSSIQLPARGTSSAPFLIPALLACYFVWGSTYLAIRFALQGIPPFFQMASRFLVAGCLLLGWVLWRNGVSGLPTRRQWLHALIIGGLMLGGGMGMIAHAEIHIGSGLIATFIAIIPMMVSMWGLFFGKRPARLEWTGMAAGMAGVALLVSGSGFSAEPKGILFVLLATLSWSLGSVLSTSKFPLADGAAGFASEMLCGGLVLLLLALLTCEALPAWPVPLVPAVAWLYLVVFGSLVAFSSYMYLLAHASAALATSYAFVNPVIALLLGMVVGGEQITAWEWVATGVILTGVVLILYCRHPSPSSHSASPRKT